MMFILLKASRFLYTNLYLLMNIATRKLSSNTLNKNVKKVMKSRP